MRKGIMALASCLLIGSLVTGQKKTLSDDWRNDPHRYQKLKANHTLSFEKKVPEGWKAKGSGSLSLSPKHYKEGNKSLEWSWKNGGSLMMKEVPNLESATTSKAGGMMFWLYNESTKPGNLTFSFQNTEGKRLFSFIFQLNFTGWRCTWINFRDDASNPGKEAATQLKVIPSESLTEGKVYLDLWNFVDKIYGSRSSSFQFQRKGNVGDAWSTYRWSQYKPDLSQAHPVTDQEKAAFQSIEKRLKDYVLGTNQYTATEAFKLRKGALDKYIKKGKKLFERLDLQRHTDGGITGQPLFSRNSPYKPKMNEHVSQFICLPLVLDYKINGNRESLKKFILLLDHMHDQGWAEGSGMGTLDHETLRSAGYMYACFLAKEELKEQGLLDREMATMKWFMTRNMIFAPKDYEITADNMRTRYIFNLLQTLMLDDSPEKVVYMNKTLEYINYGLQIKPGFADVIKDDFTGYHHRCIYGNGYAPPAFLNAAFVNYLLHNTPFALANTSEHNLRQAILTQRIMANLYHTPTGIGGRLKNHDTLNRYLGAFMFMAWSGDPIDREMAAAFMRLWHPESSYLKERLFSKGSCDMLFNNTLGEIEMMYKLADQGIEAEKAPSGFWSKPYGALAIHRRDNWMVSAKGFSQYIYDFESGGKNNIYGRYISYGALQILAKGNIIDFDTNGYALDKGWDWNRWPGATTVHYPLKTLRTHRKGEQSKHRNFSKETFVGAVSLEGQNGLWAMKLNHDVFEKEFKGIKTAFFFDNQIILLGSDITCSNKSQKVETTIFQNWMPSKKNPVWVNGKEVTNFPFNKDFTQDKSVFLNDAYGNSYVIPKANDLHISRLEQTSKLEDTRKQDTETHGTYSVAWINHGINPKEQGYEYVILVDTDASEAKKYSRKIPYQIIEKDKTAHILNHPDFHTTGYAIMEPKAYEKKPYGVVEKVSTPVMVMAKEQKDLTLSLCDPDFHRGHYKNTSELRNEVVFDGDLPHPVQLTLKGNWKLKDTHPDVKVISNTNDKTVLKYNCQRARTYEVRLEKL